MVRRTTAAVAVLVTCLGVYAGGNLKSGPQPGDVVPGPFHPLNINGEFAGKKNCLYCANGTNPVAVVFAREVTPELRTLLQQLDAATVKNAPKRMGSFAVFTSDNEKLPDELKTLAEKAGFKKLILSVDNPAGPEGYEIAKDASVTVLLYRDVIVSSNFAFRKGELNDAAIAKVVGSVSKIVAE